MKKHLVSINDLPPDGKEFALDDQEIWLEPLREFKMDCRIAQPLQGSVFLQRADDGVLVRGTLKGEVIIPCNRCTEDTKVAIDSKFDEYEEIPEENIHAKAGEHDGHVVYEMHAPMLNLAEVAWEQFMLALPSRTLCREDCKGLCPSCGTNLNWGECDCKNQSFDDRMAPLAGLKIQADDD